MGGPWTPRSLEIGWRTHWKRGVDAWTIQISFNRWMDKQTVVYLLVPKILSFLNHFSYSFLLSYKTCHSVCAYPLFRSSNSLSLPLYFIKATLIATVNGLPRITFIPYSYRDSILHGHDWTALAATSSLNSTDMADTDILPAFPAVYDNTAASDLNTHPLTRFKRRQVTIYPKGQENKAFLSFLYRKPYILLLTSKHWGVKGSSFMRQLTLGSILIAPTKFKYAFQSIVNY